MSSLRPTRLFGNGAVFFVLILFGAFTLPIAVSPVGAEEQPAQTSYFAELGIGLAYDSNVAIDELDTTSNASDTEFLFDASAGIEHPFSESTQAKLWYEFSFNDYRDFSDGDRRGHLIAGDLRNDFGPATAGVTGFYINSALDGEDFLEIYKLAPNVSGSINSKLFARLGYVYTDKDIKRTFERDADSHTVELDLYYFFSGPQSYVNIGYKRRAEEAGADLFDYDGDVFKLRYVNRFDVFDKRTRLELSWRFENRDYSSVTPSIGAERADDRHQWRVEYEIPMHSRGTLQLFAAYFDYKSNLPSVDYYQTMAGFHYRYRWE